MLIPWLRQEGLRVCDLNIVGQVSKTNYDSDRDTLTISHTDLISGLIGAMKSGRLQADTTEIDFEQFKRECMGIKPITSDAGRLRYELIRSKGTRHMDLAMAAAGGIAMMTEHMKNIWYDALVAEGNRNRLAEREVGGAELIAEQRSQNVLPRPDGSFPNTPPRKGSRLWNYPPWGNSGAPPSGPRFAPRNNYW